MKACFRIMSFFVCLLLLGQGVLATDGETLFNDEYCFSAGDFSGEALSGLCGIFVTQVPEENVAVIRLDGRIIRPGDVLSASMLERLRLSPVSRESCDAVFAYQPVFGTALGDKTRLTIRIQSGKNETPTAIEQEFETYKNIANDGKLSGADPENAPLTFQLVEKPKRGTVRLEADGTYLYTPDKNKVGEDSFTFTVTDEAGNVSSPAAVKVKILKPTEAMTFSDMEGNRNSYEALWLCCQNLTSGRSIAGNLCFCPDEAVSRVEFLVMAMELNEIPVDPALTVSGFADASQAPAWVQPYMAAAMQRGIISGEVHHAGLLFRPNDAITGQEAAVLLQNIMKLPVSAALMDSGSAEWAASSVQALNEAGISLPIPTTQLTRAQVANLLWQIARLSK